MTTDLREKIAEVLAGHARYELAPGSNGLPEMQCKCGFVLDFNKSANQIAADWRAHVAEAILAAIGPAPAPGGYLQRDCPGQDCRRHAPGQHTHERYVGSWLPVDTEDPRRALTEEAP